MDANVSVVPKVNFSSKKNFSQCFRLLCLLCFVGALVYAPELLADAMASLPTPSDSAAQKTKSPTLAQACHAPQPTLADSAPDQLASISFKAKKRDRSCLMPGASALKQISNPQFKIIDVRNPLEFARYRIPGSLNVSLHSVKTKFFLKVGTFVLVDEGRSSVELAAACQELRQAGFTQAHVLDGGLAAWKENGGVLDGDVLAQRSLNSILPEELFAERLYDDWLVLDFSGQTKTGAYKWLPRPIEYISPENSVQGIKSAAARKSASTAHIKILVITNAGKDYEKIARHVHQAGLNNVLYLQGGLQAYNDFMFKQAAMWAQAGKSPKLPACRG